MLPPLKKQVAEICLILEDSFPFQNDPEATWVHQLITALPRVKFAIYHIGTGRKNRSRNLDFELPENVVTMASTFIFTPAKNSASRAPKRKEIREIVDALRRENPVEIFEAVAEIASDTDFEKFWKHPDFHEAVTAVYQAHFANEPYAPFLAQAREMLLPIWRLMADFQNLPAATAYHAIGTGYGGLLGVIAKRATGKPLMISEQSITVRDRIGELLREEWTSPEVRAHEAFRHLWIEFFILAARISYESADHVIAAFQKNRDYQAEFGADPEKIQLIRNGVDLPKFETARRERTEILRPKPDRKHVGFLGRIAPRNDLKTLIHAARLVIDRDPHVRFFIGGTQADESGFFHECRNLICDLDLRDEIKFLVRADSASQLPRFDLLISCDQNAGQPVAILEAFASQIPVIGTDVGDSRNLILGETDDWGRAGEIVPIGDARKLADTILNLLNEPARRNRLGANGRRRVEADFSDREMFDSFQKIYDRFSGRITSRFGEEGVDAELIIADE